MTTDTPGTANNQPQKAPGQTPLCKNRNTEKTTAAAETYPAEPQHSTDTTVSEPASAAYIPAHTAAAHPRTTEHNLPRTSKQKTANPAANPAEKTVPIEIRTVKTRKELAYSQPKLHTEKFTRWNKVPELQNRQSLEIILDQYRDVKLAAYALNCSKHMIYAAIAHHGIPYPRVYSSKRTELLLHLTDSRVRKQK